MDKTQLGSIQIHKQDGVNTIMFSHPAHNSLPGKLLTTLSDAIETAGIDPEVKVIILKSGGERTFCAGASFDELIAIEDMEAGKIFFSGFANVINALRKCPKLVICRVQGKTIGGGVGIAAACDYCMATKFAKVKLSELAVGIGPFVVGPAVERKIGTAAMSQLAINATELESAEWARDKGLFTHVYDSVEELDEAVEVLSKKLVASNPDAMRLLKKVFWTGTEHWDELLAERAAISGQLVLSDFTKNAIRKFKA